MCEEESVSVEHAPPRSFFPKGMRHQLITVPSCKKHNEDTSLDDEYVRNIITMSIENNQISIDHFFDKTLRSFERSPALTSKILETLKGVSGYETGAKAFRLERSRFDRVIRKIAYALFYNEFGYSWERLLAATTNQIKMPDMSNDHLGEMFDELMKDADSIPLKGSNHQVFQYAFVDFSENPHDKALFMIFYEGFPFWIIPDKTSTISSFD